jgi:phage-related protein
LKPQAKIYKYLDYLRDNKGYLDEPYSRHIKGKMRELRIDFASNRYRLFYFLILNKVIIILHAYLKKSNKTSNKEVKRAELNLLDCLNNLQIYED